MQQLPPDNAITLQCPRDIDVRRHEKALQRPDSSGPYWPRRCSVLSGPYRRLRDTRDDEPKNGTIRTPRRRHERHVSVRRWPRVVSATSLREAGCRYILVPGLRDFRKLALRHVSGNLRNERNGPHRKWRSFRRPVARKSRCHWTVFGRGGNGGWLWTACMGIFTQPQRWASK